MDRLAGEATPSNIVSVSIINWGQLIIDCQLIISKIREFAPLGANVCLF